MLFKVGHIKYSLRPKEDDLLLERYGNLCNFILRVKWRQERWNEIERKVLPILIMDHLGWDKPKRIVVSGGHI